MFIFILIELVYYENIIYLLTWQDICVYNTERYNKFYPLHSYKLQTVWLKNVRMTTRKYHQQTAKCHLNFFAFSNADFMFFFEVQRHVKEQD